MADYAAIRPAMRETLLDKAADFQVLNTAKYGINLPAGGYTINNLFAAFVADMDEAEADGYDGRQAPFAMGYTVRAHVQRDDGPEHRLHVRPG